MMEYIRKAQVLDEEALKHRGKTHEHQRRMDELQRQRKEHLREVPRGRCGW